MGLVIGMDEAGYGPNLGPLVLTATVWEVPGRWPQRTDFWQIFADIAERKAEQDGDSSPEANDDPSPKPLRKKSPGRPRKNGNASSNGSHDASEGSPNGAKLLTESDRLHIADSKQVYNTSIGLGALERSVLATFGIASQMPSALNQLLDELQANEACDDDGLGDRGRRGRELWFEEDVDLPLPLSEEGQLAGSASERWRTICETSGVRLRAIRSDVVSPRRWNRENRRTENKATTLSRLHLQLLRRVWNPDDPGPTVVIADKHGGRNYYGDLLVESLDGRMVCCRGESRSSSIYRVGGTEIRFEAKAERHFPVAVASMVSKYVRELTMELFNRFWRSHLPELKPTHGYPTDSRRFRRDVAEVQSRLAIADDVLWRER